MLAHAHGAATSCERLTISSGMLQYVAVVSVKIRKGQACEGTVISMKEFSQMTFEELLREGGHACSCGRTHTTGLKFLRVGKGAVEALPEALAFLGKGKPFVVADANTQLAAGRRVLEVLRRAGIPFVSYVFPEQEERLEPDEYACGALAMAFDPSCDVVVGVGSGVINDCCKILAHTAKIPSVIVGTAPSMDGYASNSASMVVNRIKVSLYCASPVAILADTDIMKDAPTRMLWAGLGDMLAKYTALAEWRISHEVNGEFYCEKIAQLVRESVRRVVENADKLMQRAPEAVEAVVKGLILSGVAMDFAKCSRPASGLEHYFSHMWEMSALAKGERSDLHGIQVGVGVCLELPVLEKLLTFVPDKEAAERAVMAITNDEWEKQVREIFGPTANEIIRLEHMQYHKNDKAGHDGRLRRIIERWPEILRAIREEVPTSEELLPLMRATGMPTTPQEIGLGKKDVHNAFIGSREIRDKYLLSSLLWDLGVLNEFYY